MGVYTEYMTVYDGICQVVRIPDVVLSSSSYIQILLVYTSIGLDYVTVFGTTHGRQSVRE